MPKNLILIHLESISNTILWQYRVELKTVWKMREMSYSYNRFYSAATSTAMALQSLAHGSDSVYDESLYFGDQFLLQKDPRFLKDNVNRMRDALFFYDYCMRPERLDLLYEIADKPSVTYKNNTLTARDQEEWFPLVRSFLMRNREDKLPFFLHFISGITHITYNDKVKAEANSFSERFRVGYLRLDSGINKFLSLLREFKMFDNSVIVFYGDHGDELWSHGLNGGWCHATTPYASQCWTPLFIYETGQKPGSTNQLASMTDLRETLIKRLIPDFDPEKCVLGDPWKSLSGKNTLGANYMHAGRPREGTLPPFKSTPFHGIDLAKETREYAFSQALFGLQAEFNDFAEALTKGYAVTDGTYRLTVTSGGRDGRNGGMEFFCDTVDPTNSRNLLDFFRLDANGDIKDFYPPPEMTSREFKLMFSPEAVRHLTETYQTMKKVLHERIRAKEEAARPFARPESHYMPEAAFKHSVRRPYKD